MASSGTSTVSPSHEGDRFYNPPIVRRQHYQQQQQQWLYHPHLQQRRQLQSSRKSEFKADIDESALLKPSVCSSFPPPTSTLTTNLDRLMESVTPLVPTRYMPVATTTRGWEAGEAELRPFFSLGDLWESFKEWSVYGVGVPLLLNGKDPVKQYYVPFLSGIQLYIDPSKHSSRPGKPCESEAHKQQTLISQRLSKLSLNLRDKPCMTPSRVEALATDSISSSSTLVFEFLEQDQPHQRKPLIDKITALTSQFPQLRLYSSSDLLPSSWFSVAWYPIYRIPIGPTLQNLEASFLTFHSLSTPPKSTNTGLSAGRKLYGSKICLPMFGLASYKLKGSILSPMGGSECEQEDRLLLNADQWLRNLHVDLPDYRFFVSHTLHSR